MVDATGHVPVRAYRLVGLWVSEHEGPARVDQDVGNPRLPVWLFIARREQCVCLRAGDGKDYMVKITHCLGIGYTT